MGLIHTDFTLNGVNIFGKKLHQVPSIEEHIWIFRTTANVWGEYRVIRVRWMMNPDNPETRAVVAVVDDTANYKDVKRVCQ